MKQLMKRTLTGTVSLLAIAAISQAAWGGMDSHKEKAARASSVTGLNVMTRDGADLGAVNDLVISLDDGKIDSLVVETGFLGLGGPERVLGYDMLDGINVDGTSFSLSVRSSKSEFENLPELDETNLATDSSRGSKISRHDIEAMNYIYSDIESKSGSHLGEVKDWIVDLDDGKVTHVIIRRNEPIAPLGYAYYAIGIDSLEGTRSGDIVTSLKREDLGDAVDLDENSGELNLRDSDAPVYQFSYRANEMAMAD